MRESDNDKCIKNLVSVFVSTTSYSLFSVATEQVIIVNVLGYLKTPLRTNMTGIKKCPRIM